MNIVGTLDISFCIYFKILSIFGFIIFAGSLIFAIVYPKQIFIILYFTLIYLMIYFQNRLLYHMCLNKSILNCEGFEITQEECVHHIRAVRRNATQKKLDQLWRHFANIFDQTNYKPAVIDILGKYIIRIQNRKDPSEGYTLINMSVQPELTKNTLNGLKARLTETFNETAYRADLSNDLRALLSVMFNKQIQRNKFRNEPSIIPIPKLQNNNACDAIYKPICPVKNQNPFCTSSGWLCPIVWTPDNNLPPANNGQI